MSKIEWTERTWNPVTGCDKISAGCKNCYAETMANRLQAMGQANYANGFKVTLQPQMLDVPLKRKKPTMWFVNSMSDLFHKDIPFEFIDRVFGMMTLCPQHTFQILTKRADRLKEYMERIEDAPDLVGFAAAYWAEFEDIPMYEEWPPKHIWLGVSVENQKAADERIPLLLETPAAIRFLSCEPLLGAVDLTDIRIVYPVVLNSLTGGHFNIDDEPITENGKPIFGNKIDWAIVGGESGPKPRFCQLEWIRSIVEQCRGANVPVFVKQLGSFVYYQNPENPRDHLIYKTKFKGGDINEFPKDLQIREFPKQ